MSGNQHREVTLHGRGSVHLYSADLDGCFTESRKAVPDTLSPEELDRASRFHRRLDGDRFLASRYLLRTILGEFAGLKPESIVFKFNPFGKPELKGASIGFNLSHSGRCFALAISGSARVGVDVETRITSETAGEVAPRILSNREFSIWKDSSHERRTQTFARYWVLKEAILKAYGEGLSQDPRKIELLLEGPQSVIVGLPEDFGEIRDWRLVEFPATEFFPEIALAVII